MVLPSLQLWLLCFMPFIRCLSLIYHIQCVRYPILGVSSHFHHTNRSYFNQSPHSPRLTMFECSLCDSNKDIHVYVYFVSERPVFAMFEGSHGTYNEPVCCKLLIVVPQCCVTGSYLLIASFTERITSSSWTVINRKTPSLQWNNWLCTPLPYPQSLFVYIPNLSQVDIWMFKCLSNDKEEIAVLFPR